MKALRVGKVFTAEDRKMRLPWWGRLCVFVVVLPLPFLFGYFGKVALGLPTVMSGGMVAIAIAMRWKLRRHVWFWITMTVLAALQVPLILFVPWTTKWVPAITIAPIALADLYAMLWTLAAVGKFMGEPINRKRPLSKKLRQGQEV
jgi:hypothetical protein